MSELRFALVDAGNFDEIPSPAAPGARCQTCDYWERLDGHRAPPEAGVAAAHDLKRSRLLAGTRLAGAYAMLAYRLQAPVGYAQFGPISAYPRAQAIRDRYPQLPDSPAPWVVTCLQVTPDGAERLEVGAALLGAVCEELDRRGITAVEAYPEAVADAWLPSPGPATLYEANRFERVVDDARYPVVRRELTGDAAAAGWGDLLRHVTPVDEGAEWPIPMPRHDEDDLFRLPAPSKRRNPFGDD